MSVIVNMACGLANRMFQYSYYLFLKHKGYNVKVDFYNSAKLAHEKVSWNGIFQKLNRAGIIFDVLKSGGGSDLFSKVRRKYLPILSSVVNMPTAFDANLPNENKSYNI